MACRAPILAYFAAAVVVGIGTDVEDQAMVHDFLQERLNAFGHADGPGYPIFCRFTGYDDAGKGDLVEMHPGTGHGSQLLAVAHAGVGQHRGNQAGVGRAVGE